MQSSQAEGAKMLTGSSSHAAGTGMPHSGGGITTLVVCNSFTDCGEHITIMDRLRQNDRTLGSNLDYRHILTKTIEKKRFTGDVLRALTVNRTIQSACLKGGDITGANVDLLCTMLVRNCTLLKLSLEGCNLQRDFEEIAKHLAENKSLRYINLRSNFLEFEGAKQLFTHLPRSRVTSVNLSQNGIIDAAGGLFQAINKAQKAYDAAVKKKVPEPPSVLTQLDISSNQISPVVNSKIMAIVNTNARVLTTQQRQAREQAREARHGARQSAAALMPPPAAPAAKLPTAYAAFEAGAAAAGASAAPPATAPGAGASPAARPLDAASTATAPSAAPSPSLGASPSADAGSGPEAPAGAPGSSLSPSVSAVPAAAPAVPASAVQSPSGSAGTQAPVSNPAEGGREAQDPEPPAKKAKI